MPVESLIGIVLSILQVLALLPIWGQWRRVKDTPEQIKSLESNFIASLLAVNKRVDKLEVTQDKHREDTLLDVRDLYKKMEALNTDVHKGNLEFTKVLSEVKETLATLTTTVRSVNDTIKEYKQEVKEEIRDLKQRLNGIK